MAQSGLGLKVLMNLKSDHKQAKNELGKVDSGITGSIANVTGYIGALKELEGTLENLIGSSADYIESLNLLGVAFKDTAMETKNWAKNLANAYGLDESTLVHTLGIFRQIGNSLEIDSEYADKFAKSITEMQLDLSSLYNLSFDRAGSVLQSAISGQYKSLKSATGADITEATLSQDLLNLGIDRTIDELSRAERVMLIYNSVARQLSESNGDLARTINSPANQMKVFSEQVQRLGRAIGNVLLPIIGKLLPYLNAILMVIVELVNMLAIFVGYDEDMLSGLGTGMESVADGFESGASAANDLSNAAKEAKKSLRGFDKLNTISTPSSSGSGGASAGLGSIDPKLLGILDEYESKLADINSKATKIRDNIMKWLGFAKNSNGEWEHVKWTYGDILLIAGGIFLAVKKIYGIAKLLNKIGLFNGLKDSWKILKQIIMSIPAFADLPNAFIAIKGAIAGIVSGSISIADAWAVWILPAVETIAVVIGGIVAVILGIKRAVEGIIDVLNGDTFNGILEIIEGIALVVAGVALLFGGWVIALVAACVAIVAYVIQYWDEIKEFITGVWQKILDFMSPFGDWLKKNIIDPIYNFFEPIFSWINEKIIQPVISGIKKIVNNIKLIVDKVIEIVAKIVEIIVALAKATWDYLIKPFIDWIADLYKKFKENFIDPAKKIISDIAKYVYDHFIKYIVDGIKWVYERTTKIFKSIANFAADFIGGAIKGVVNGIFWLIEKNINNFISLLNSAINVINKIPGVSITKVSKLSLPRLAEGGFVDEGQLFIAREKGAELVGNLNGRTAVANNDQIAEGIRAAARDGFLDAMRYSGGQNVEVNITAEGDSSGLLNFIKFKEKQQDRQFGL